MICCFITGVSIYTCIRYVHAVHALFGWQGQVTYNSPYTVLYTPTQYNTQYYTHFRLKISVYASPIKRDKFYCCSTLICVSVRLDQAITLQSFIHEVPNLLEICSPGSIKALSLANTTLREQVHASVRSIESTCVQASPQSKDIVALVSALLST